MLQEGEARVLNREVWRLISAFDAHSAQMKLIAIEGDNLELALHCKKALEVIQKLKKTSDLNTIVADIKPFDTLLSKDLQAFLSSLLSESSTQDDIVPALLAELSADLEEAKKRAICEDELDVALTIKHAATTISHLRQHPPSAADVFTALSKHKEVISEEWQARIYSLVPSSRCESGSPAKRSRTTK